MKQIPILLLFSITLPSFCTAQKEFGLFESQICLDSSDVIVQLGDSLYAYSFETDLYRPLGEILHGISSSFDIRLEPIPVIVSQASFDSVYINDGTGWTFTTHHANNNHELGHTAAGRKTAYFMAEGLWFYNGISNPVLIRPDINSTVADLVVDENERAWVLTGKNFPIADTLKLIDSTGASICNFPFDNPINTYNGYGMFIKNGKIYVGFGPYNPGFANSIVPLVFETTKVHFGAAIPFQPNPGIDLGSCSKWVDYPRCVIVSNVEIAGTSQIDIYPNPFSQELNVTVNNLDDVQLDFYNAMGMKVAERKGTQQGVLTTENWEKGIFYCIISQNGFRINAVKLVKM